MSAQSLRRLAIAVVVAALLSAGAVLAQSPASQPAHFEITIPDGVEIRNDAYYAQLAISPDGRYVVFVNRGETPVRLYRRDLRTGTTAVIAGVERGAAPFFSPDGRWVAFVASGRLWKVPVAGGEPVELAPIENFFGGTWGLDGTIVYAPEPGSGLYMVSAEGGAPERLTESGWFPSFLPGGRWVLFNQFTPELDTIAVVDIRTGQIDSLSITGRTPQYAPSGHLVFGRGLDLWAVGFDAGTRELRGPVRAVVSDVGIGTEPPRQFSVSGTGTMVYVRGGKAIPSEPVRVDLGGTATSLGMSPRYYVNPRFSPDGSRLAFAVQEPNRSDLWVAGADGGEARKLIDGGLNWFIDWMPDGEELFIWKGPNPGALQALPISGDPTPKVLFSAADKDLKWLAGDGFTPDGETIVGRVPPEGDGVSAVALLGTNAVGEIEVLETSSEAGVEYYAGTVSPDGKWLAFVSDHAEGHEVYVRPFPADGPERQVSGEAAGWAFYPHWSPDSQAVYYIQGAQMWRADVGARVEDPITRRSLFEFPDDLFWHSGDYTSANFDLAPDGESFLMLRGVGEWKAPSHISVITNLEAAIEASLSPEGAVPGWASDLLATWYAGYAAGDAVAVAGLYAEDAVIGDGIRGRDAIQLQFEERFAQARFECTGGYEAFREINGHAVGWGHDVCTEIPHDNGAPVVRRSSWFSVMERQADGTWRIVRDIGEGQGSGS